MSRKNVNIPLADIEVGNRHRRDLGDIPALAASIEQLGLLHPVVLGKGDQLVAGQRRIEAFRHLGRTSIPATIIESLADAQQLLEAERDENTCRKQFTPEEAVAIGTAIEKSLATTVKRGRPEGSTNGKTFPIKSRDESKRLTSLAAASVGMSRPTYERAREVIAAAEQEPERFGHLVEEMNKTGRVAGVARKLKVARQVEAISQEPVPLPQGPFRVIVADPPWQYGRSDDPSHRGSCPYPTMTLDEIRAMPVEAMAHDDCVLWLWTTNSHLPHAFGIAEAWGFEYKVTLTWGKQRIGTGDYLRGRTEHCLLCVRGRPVLNLSNQDTLLIADADDHSRKPAAFFELVESLCPGSKLELFSREQRPGWNTYGDEVAQREEVAA